MITKSEISRVASLILFLFCLNASAQSLKIVAVEPLPNRVNVTRDADIRLEFNKAVSSSWIHSNSLIVFGEKSGQIKGDISFSENHFAAIFHPQRPFIVGDRITVVLVRQPNLPEDLLKKGYIWEFNIAPETGGKEYFSLQFDASMRLTSLSAADFDQDGCVDLAMAGSIDDKEFLRLAFYQNGQLHFRDPVQVPDRVRPFYCGDLNRDGFSDFVLVHRGRQKFSIEPRISIYYLSADGNLVAGQTIDLAFSRLGVAEPRAAAINDFNGDGYLDIIVMTLNSTRKSALVYLNDGTGKFPEDDDKIEWFDNSSTAQSIFARDLNNSGFIDIGIGHSGGLNASVNLYLNNGTATFSNPLLGIRGGRDLEMSNAMDLNGDLIPDLLSADYDLHQLFVSFCEGIDGSKSPPSPIYQINSTKFNTVLHPNWMELGDLDADGDMDPVLTGSKQADIWIMWNEQGSFASSSQIAVSPQPTNFVIGDLNSDHSLDIVVADTTGLITVLFNNIDGFQAPYAPNLLQPADLALSNNHYPVFQWLTPADINPQDSLHFRLTIQDADGKRHVFDSMSQPALFSPTPPVIQGGGLITFTMPDSLPDHDYTWFVEAFDLLFWGQPSESWRFTIDSQPPAQVSIAFPDADYDGEWFAIQGDSLISAEVTYTELHPLQAEISTVGLGGPFYYNDLLGGNNVKQTLSFLPTHSADGKFPITVKIIDR
ncbi:MAG: VCBS repeat-containing protein, partial [Calditrichaeota bacterium]